MSKAPSFQFYPADWLNDSKLAGCPHEAKGLLIDLMCLMHQSEKYGHLLIGGQPPSDVEVNRVVRCQITRYRTLIQLLINKGVLKTDEHGVIYCQRMVKDEELRQVRRKCGALGGNPALTNLDKVDVNSLQKFCTPPSSSSSSSSSKKNKLPKRENGFSKEFLEFYQAYPRKVGKLAAWHAWNKAARPALSLMLEKLELQKKSPEWTKDGGQFIPHPSTWLNQGRWEDETKSEEELKWARFRALEKELDVR